MTILAEVNPENLSKETTDSFGARSAVRAVLLDGESKVALLHVRKHGYHKLPGGGIEEGESTESALMRDCLEETGCTVKIGEEVGSIVEYRGEFQVKQISQCFIATVKGRKGVPSFTESETADQFELLWVDFDEAQSLLEVDSPTDYQGKFITARDRVFTREAMKLLT